MFNVVAFQTNILVKGIWKLCIMGNCCGSEENEPLSPDVVSQEMETVFPGNIIKDLAL